MQKLTSWPTSLRIIFTNLARLSLFALTSFNFGHSEEASPIIRTYNTEDGLSSHNIISITQDETGYLWVGTDDGINRFDGRKFNVYRNEPGDTTTISDSRVTVVLSAQYHNDKVLWVGTRNGLNRIDLTTGISKMYLHDPGDENSLSHPIVTTLAIDSDGFLWVGTENGLNILTNGGQSVGYFRRIKLEEEGGETPGSNFIRSLVVGPGYGSNKSVWAGTRNGLKHIQYQTTEDYTIVNYDFSQTGSTPNENEIRALLLHESKGKVLLYIGTDAGDLLSLDLLNLDEPTRVARFDHFIRDIEMDQYEQVWVATYGGGLTRLNGDGNNLSLTQFIGSPQLGNSLSNSHTVDLFLDRAGVLWVATDNGLNAFLQPSRGFKTLVHKPDDPQSLVGSGIRSIYEDSQGGLWVGTVASGLSFLSHDRSTVEQFIHDPADPTSITVNSIASILEDHYGNMWFGTWEGGLLKLNESDRSFKAFESDPQNKNSLPDNVVQGLLEDRDGSIWINTGNGLSRFDPESERFVNYYHDATDSTSISEGDFQSKAMYLDRNNYLWVGSYGGGLNGLDLKKAENMDPARAKFIHLRNDPKTTNSISNDMAISLLGTWDGEQEILWVGTFNGGFNRIEIDPEIKPELWLVTRYSEHDGLCDNVVFGIEADNRGQLWMSTGAGLARFEPGTEKFTSYYIEDGLPANSFFWGASHCSKQGEMFFGTTDGLVYFFPESIVGIQPVIPKISITGIANVDGALSRRPENFDRTQHVFTHDQGPFTIEWALFDFAMPQKNSYRYKIDGLHDTWISAGNATSATFGNLEGGQFTFRVRGANYNGVSTADEGVIQIRIRPPVYKTLVFKILVFVFLGLLIYLVIAIRTQAVASTNRQLLSINKELIRSVSDKEHAEAVIRSSLKEKEALLREIYHRTKNNMSVIIALLNLQSAKLENPEIDEIFEEVKGRIYAMSLVHEQLMRTEDLSAIKLTTYIHELTRNLQRGYQDLESRVQTVLAIEQIEVSIDTAVPLGLVLNEIITNSLKYAFPGKQKGHITIKARMVDENLYIQIKDDGIGFDPDAVLAENKSLGLGIIKTIVEEQLDGTLSVSHENGTCYELTISDVRIIRRV